MVMRRRLLNLSTALSLLLFIAIATLWGRSYGTWDRWAGRWPGATPYTTDSRYGGIESWRGELRTSYIPLGGRLTGYSGYWGIGGFSFSRTLVHVWEMNSGHAPTPPYLLNGPALDGY